MSKETIGAQAFDSDADAHSYHPAQHGDWIDPDPETVQQALDHVGERTNVLSFLNGIFREKFDARVTSDGATITMSLEKSGTGDLTMVFSDGQTVLDTTPALTIALTAGLDTAPQQNFIYILQSTKALTKSTSDWPTAEHIRIAFIAVPTASLVNTGASGNNFVYVIQNWNDFTADPLGQGHLTHIAERLRRLPAERHSGVAGVATQDGNDLWVSVAVGEVYQAHLHTFAALDSDTAGAGDAILVPNDPDANYAMIHSLNEITKLSGGTSIGNNKYIKFVLWGVINKSGEVSLMMINLPAGLYNTASDARIDVEGHSNFTIPAAFNLESSTGFLIAAFICKHTATAMEIEETIDLRGETPSTASGSGTGGGDVSALAVLADNAIVRGDGGAKDIQDSGVLIDDSDAMSGLTALDVDNLKLDGNTVSSTDTNGDINVTPDGTGLVNLGKAGDTVIGDGTEHDTYPQTDLKVNLGKTANSFKGVFVQSIYLKPLTNATRGAAGTAGRVIFNSDDGQLNIDDGTNWTLPDGTTT